MSKIVAELVGCWFWACVVQNVVLTVSTVTFINEYSFLSAKLTLNCKSSQSKRQNYKSATPALTLLVDHGRRQNDEIKATQPFVSMKKNFSYEIHNISLWKNGITTSFGIIIRNKCSLWNGSSLAEKFPSFIARRLRCLSCIVSSGLVLIKYFPVKLLKFQWTRSCLVF